VNPKDIKRTNRLEQINDARDYAFRLLAYRGRTCKEITERLIKRGYGKQIARKVVEELKRLRYLDDHAFAREWVESRLRDKRGKAVMRQKLLEKGLEEKLVEDTINEGFRNIALNEDGLAWQAIEKKIPQYQKLGKAKAYRRIRDFLIRRGFSPEAIENILEKFLQRYVEEEE